MKVLIVDDERKILDVVEAYLVAADYLIYRAETGSQALEKFQKVRPDLIVLDLMLPDIDGLEVCRQVRQINMTPIIMLTAKSGEKNVIHGLRTGADDYLIKPFSPKELVARVESVLRRTGQQPLKSQWRFNHGELIIDSQSKEVYHQGTIVNLTTTEFELLQILARTPNQVFSREQLILAVKGIEFTGFDRVIDSHIKNLRQKIEKDSKKPEYIVTIHGSGYRFGGQYETD